MFSPHLTKVSVGAFACAFDEAMKAAFPNRTFLAVGLSVGGLVAMSMQASSAFVAVDAPLSTASIWSMIGPMRKFIQANPGMTEWVGNILGIARDSVVNRDYRPLVASATKPGIFVIAGEPLEPPRPLQMHPGVLTAEDRAFVTAQSSVEVIVAEGSGHDVPYLAPAAFARSLERGLSHIVT
jgi:pimeloyl-ACP methyl ester carboxylesterase